MPRLVIHCAAAGLAAWLSTVAAMGAPAAMFTTVYRIPGLNDGASPLSALIKVGRAYYGTASSGGDFDHGTIFKIDAATGAETTLHSFADGNDGSVPVAPLIAYQGKLYGTTERGGPAEAGTVFAFDPATGAETIIASFAGFPHDSGPAAPLVAYGNALYGTTGSGGNAESGTIFKIDPTTGTETSLYAFGTAGNNDGLFPQAGMIVVGNVLYGTTAQGGQFGSGTLFRFDPATNAETSAYALRGGSDGAFPEAPLTQSGGVLYGTASQGGSGNNGTVFSFAPASSAYAALYAFQGGADGGFPQAGLISSGGTLYGTTAGFNTSVQGSVFAIDPATGHETTLHSFSGGYDGGQPGAALLDDGGILQGVTSSGGFNNNGVAFSINPANAVETLLYNFSGSDGASATSGLLRVGNALYGSATRAGSLGYGAIIRVDAKSGAGTIVYSFKGGPDGTGPSGMLVDAGSTLYGTTMRGGAANLGTVFKLDAQGVRTTLHDFAGGNDGAEPHGGLIAVGNLLYGTTYNGGASDSGTLFSIDPATGAQTILYTFSGGGDGQLPWAPLILVNGTLYGTTLNGGVKHNGVVFAYNVATGKNATLYAFKGGADGSAPFSPVTHAGGLLYGTTSGFGTPVSGGTVFSLNPATGAETVLYKFTQTPTGEMPLGGVIETGGKLYGTTGSGGQGFGTIFSFDLATGMERTLYAFTGGADSGIPEASLQKVGKFLWGTTVAGAGNAGTVFKLKP